MQRCEFWTALLIAGTLTAAPIAESSLDQADGLAPASESGIASVYGDDDRREIYQTQNKAVHRAIRSVVMLVDASDVVATQDNRFMLKSVAYGDSLNLCRSEPFWEQPRIGFCSGVLIRKDLILTAGHCVINQRDCDNTRFLFDIHYGARGDLNLRVPAKRVRQCKKIKTRFNKNSGLDFALLELNEEVADRTPVALGHQLEKPERLFMLGHPLGLPAKFSGLAQVLRETDLEWVTDLDSSAGNSGSPVFEAQTGALIGILTAGEDGDFQNQTPNTCKLSKVCNSRDCFGEVVLKLKAILNYANL